MDNLSIETDTFTAPRISSPSQELDCEMHDYDRYVQFMIEEHGQDGIIAMIHLGKTDFLKLKDWINAQDVSHW